MYQMIKIDRIFLDLENPRHQPFSSEEQIIDYLCCNELVYELAKDIVHNGINPLEAFALLIVNKGNSKYYTVLEGNRRMCAIKLLNDPELAPVKYRKEFKKLAETTETILEIPSIIYTERDEVHTWLERIHGGLQGGVGRKSWSPEQKTRHIGNTKNLLAQRILDYAANEALITDENRKGKLTTVQRFLSNPVFRDAIGIDNRNIDDVSRTRPKHEFNHLLKRFLSDLVDEKNKGVSSRSNKAEIEAYSRTMVSEEDIIGKRIESESLNSPAVNKINVRRVAPGVLKHPDKINYCSELRNKLKEIQSYKLECMYYSICSISLESHTPLLCVGVWSFIESLTARAGRSGGTDFLSFLSNSKLSDLGFNDKENRKSIRDALERIQGYGNTTKHHEISAHFNQRQLYNDMETINKLLCKLAEQAKNF
ncbi:hypothetical protein [Legionella genomosp. 1]|uniref:hypothetical protein n=1 Tax=Legionella genomosp. 1 TaxID=1093625 RepID=UPI001056D39B|nr:hypothetical protein [Legionella genomosp. 1]